MTRRSAQLVAFGIACLLGLAVVGCGKGSDDRLDRAATEKAVAGAVVDELPAKPSKVDCPAEIPKKAGAKVVCAATVPQVGAVRFEVRQPDDSGKVEVRRLDAVVRTDEAAAEAQYYLTVKLGRPVSVVCSKARPVVLRPGGLLVCQARDGSSARTLRITVTDAAGSRRYQLVAA
jgi:hypothetical protein